MYQYIGNTNNYNIFNILSLIFGGLSMPTSMSIFCAVYARNATVYVMYVFDAFLY